MGLRVFGADFIIAEKNGNIVPYLIEINSFPGGIIFMDEKKVVNGFKSILKRLDANKLVIVENKRESITKLCRMLSKHIKVVVDANPKPEKNAVYLSRLGFIRRNINRGYKFVNHPFFVEVAYDKWLTYLLLKDEVVMPETYRAEVFNGKVQWKEAVLKPRFGEKGKGIFFVDPGNVKEKLKNIEGKYIVQERIYPMGKGFWDIRAIYIGGYIGSFKRVSNSPVVNISQGGKVEEVEKELEKIIKKEVEKIAERLK